jgi:hypothetical protein
MTRDKLHQHSHSQPPFSDAVLLTEAVCGSATGGATYTLSHYGTSKPTRRAASVGYLTHKRGRCHANYGCDYTFLFELSPSVDRDRLTYRTIYDPKIYTAAATFALEARP